MVTDDGETFGIMDTRDAIQKARDMGLDLVEISPMAKPPVCKIIDYGKFLYEQKKRQREAKKKQVNVQVKEIKFRPATDMHDYGYRMQHARDWLEGGDKVRAAIAFRGREMSHRELGAKILARLTDDLADLAEVEVAPKMEGYQMFTIFHPKKTDGKKQAAPEKDAVEWVEKEKREQRQPKQKEVIEKDDDEIF